jgi:Na+/proline symporter
METSTWVWIFAIAYWAYCIFWGVKGFFWAKTSARWAIAERGLPMWLFLLAATATSFSGWTYIGHPGLIAIEGLSYAFASFYVITIPITATFFAKRLWLLGKRYNFITPGDLYAYYYGNEKGWGEVIRVLIVLIAFLFSSFYTAVQLVAAGSIFNVTTGVPLIVGTLLLASVVFFYVAAGGIRSVAWVDSVQAFLLFLGIIVIGSFVLGQFGGWDPFIARINQLEDSYLTIPGAWDPLGDDPGAWTGLFQLTYMFSLMGIMASPAFHMWAFANRDPKPFPWQQAFASSLFIGFALFFFTAISGLGGQVLLQDGVISWETDAQVIPSIITNLLPGPAAGFVVVGALAAMQSTGAAYMGTGGSMLMRDFYVRYLRPDADHAEQVWVGRFLVFVITAVALVVSLTSQEALVLLGGLATAFGFVMYLPLVDTLWLHRFTRQGVALGLAAGIIAVSVTFAVDSLQYQFNIHSAGWGGFFAFLVAFIVSIFTRERELQNTELMEIRREMNTWLGDIDTPRDYERPWRRAAWVFVPIWFIFAIGPGMVVGNNFISISGLPPVWSWQVVWWALGLVMMWALCFKASLSRPHPEQIGRAMVELQPVIAEVGLRRARLEKERARLLAQRQAQAEAALAAATTDEERREAEAAVEASAAERQAAEAAAAEAAAQAEGRSEV